MIILASTSAHRQALLGRLGLPFQCRVPGVEEPDLPGEPPPERASRLASEKALAVSRRHPGAIVIGSDQVASLQTESGFVILHKPGDRDTCRRQLQMMSGKVVHFETGASVIGPAGSASHLDCTRVSFRKLTDAQIESYMDREPSFDCAGGFKCEGLGVTLFEKIETSDPTALIGLPLLWVCEALRVQGVSV